MDSDTDSLERTVENDQSVRTMESIKSEPEDPLEGSSCNLEVSLKVETNEEDDDEEYNTMYVFFLYE